jgi:uncharacterized protein (DUF1778 family)
VAKKPAAKQHYAARAGKITVTVYLDPRDHKILTKAAKADSRSLTEFLRLSGLTAAQGNLPKSDPKS